MTRYYYYNERNCLLAQHAESSSDHLGLSCACLDLDSRHAKTSSQSPLGQRCLTHPIHPCRWRVALFTEKPHSDVPILKWPKSFFHPKKNWFFKKKRKKKTNLDSLSDSIHWSFHCDSICSVQNNQLCSDAQRSWLMSFWRSRYTLNNHMHVFSIRNKVWALFFIMCKWTSTDVQCMSWTDMYHGCSTLTADLRVTHCTLFCIFIMTVSSLSKLCVINTFMFVLL